MPAGFVIGDRGVGTAGDTHPNWMMAHAVADPYLIVGASAIGQFHLAKHTPRDDAFVIRSIGHWLAVAVADGVGSRPLSRYGATYAVESLTTALLQPLVVPQDAAQASSTAPSFAPADYRNAVPPETSEEAEFRVSVSERKRIGLSELTAGLLKWNKKTRSEALRLKEFSLAPLRQAASVGWWLMPPPIAENSIQLAESSATKVRATEKGMEPAAEGPNTTAIVHRAFEKTHLGLRQHAQSLGMDLADLSCTALALLLNLRTGQGAVGQIGDGAILGVTARGEVKELVQAPEADDPQSTYTLNQPSFKDYLAKQVIEPAPITPFVTFLIMTDGLSGDLLYSPRPEDLERWARDIGNNLRLSRSPAQAAAGMLNWLATYQVKGSWDDRTLVVLTNRQHNHDDHQSIAK